ncbi:MAG TPA: PadR family transcriptional regulator [Chloroflexi bacterium]|nr:PadR family transcriptional regulator [Chloroflexota bacterium]
MRRRGRGRRAVRMLEPALLLLLHRGPAHGYTLLEQLDEFGLDNLNPSVVYRALRDMEARSWATSTWDEEQTQGPPRRVYHMTALGDEVLAQWAQDLEETRNRIEYLLDVYTQHMAKGEG